ncbi:MAG: hypothetical protein H0X66_00960 [Verrucomicrobia bacterium]|nr:hypothetical protein [Verrucomicrobiota bacterium]
MAGFQNPAFATFVAEIKDELILAQIRILRSNRGFEVRHASDQARPAEELKSIFLADIRVLCDFTDADQFRPLKSAPNLRTGWILLAPDDAALELALHHLYPNAVTDWFTVKSGTAPVTNYREFTARQSGMYRITAKLSDAQATDVIRACCDKKFCLKQRMWSVEGLAPDPAAEKSAIPCLEPCAILLEFARKGMRIEQEEKVTVALSPSDAASLKAALTLALQHPDSQIREADFNAPGNPRRLQLALEKLNSHGITLANAPEGE